MRSEMLVPAAQYLRMSTEDQQYSIPNQQSAIQQYAAQHGYTVVSTYTDAGRSGVALNTRASPKKLLQDVVSGQAQYKTILVYDVSRWGRFQDVDEAAHYEFLCKHAGIPIRYCAEQFENDGTMPSSIMKMLKRTMAAEYSRELGVKVFAGQRRLALMGFKMAGLPGYGLRRMMISADGRQKRILKKYERKAVKSDRVVLVPGPKGEVECVRKIFALAAKERMSPGQIALELNRQMKKTENGKPWDHLTVYRLLKNEKYIGCNTWGKTESKLGGPTLRVPRDLWARKPLAFTPIIKPETFDRVQKLIAKRKTWPKRPDEYLLNAMRRVLAREGRLTERLLKGRGIFDRRTFCKRFGSVLRAYELIGYRPSLHAFKSVARAREMNRLRSGLFTRLKELFPEQLRILRLFRQTHREVVELDGRLRLAVHICGPVKLAKDGETRWLLRTHNVEKGLPALICTVDSARSTMLNFYVMPEFGDSVRKYKVFGENHPWLKIGTKLQSLSQFYEAATKVATGEEAKGAGNICAGDVVVSRRSCTITMDGKDIILPPIDSAIFNLLVLNAGKIVSRKELSNAVDGKKLPSGNLNAHICNLRARLGPRFIRRVQTLPNQGYVYTLDSKKLEGARCTSLFSARGQWRTTAVRSNLAPASNKKYSHETSPQTPALPGVK
jgi:DNA invertase Pin-like site-specific DNA recombinase/DNA-binding winged helix-turn-helix (wHTH) protein